MDYQPFRNRVISLVTVALFLCLTSARAQFAPAPGSPFAAGTTPVAIAAGDFNGDGRPDFAVADQNSNNVTILLGNVSGGYTPAPASPFKVGSAPLSIVVADFNGDGIADLAVANSGSASVTILLGNGGGGFAPASGSPVPVGTGANGPLSVVTGDFNGDGKPDLAITTNPSGVVVLLGDGKGGFAPASGSPFTGNFIAVGDFNGDGRSDLAAFSNGVATITMWLGQSNGGFTAGPSSPFKLGSGPFYSLAAGDFNADGKLDLAIANFGSNNLTVLLGNGSGGFTEASGSPVPAGTQPYSLAPADFNGDGHLDLAVGYIDGNSVTVLLGDGSGGFSAIPGGPFSTGTQPISLVTGDFNADGKPDIAAANFGTNNVTVLLNTLPSLLVNPAELQFYAAAGQAAAPGIGVAVNPQSGPTGTYTVTSNQAWLTANPASGSTGTPATVTLSAAPGSLEAGNYQGTIRFNAPGYFGAAVSVGFSIANPSGAFTLAPGAPSVSAVSAAVGDFNGDGKPDLAVTNNSYNLPSTVTVLLGDGAGGFTQSYNAQFPSFGSAIPVGVGDFNGDGKLDLAIVTYGTSSMVTILLGDGQGGFTAASGGPFPAGQGASSIAVADFNGDGNPDLAIGNHIFGGASCCAVTVLLGNGHGGFAAAPASPFSVTGPGAAFTVWAADFNGDGKPDIAFFDGSVTVLLGDGHAGFQTAAGSPFGSGGILASFADLNGDGKLDFAIVETGTITTWLGDGSGGFTAGPSTPYFSFYPPPSLAVADFDGDGKPDLALFTPNPIPVNGITMMLGDGHGGFTAAPAGIATVLNSPAVVADFNGDGRPDLAGATSILADGSLQVLLGSLAPTSCTLTTTATNPVPVGVPVPLTANVTSTGYATPSGTVSLLDGATLLGTSKLTNNSATFSATLSPGNHNLTATYNGDTRTLASPPSSTLQVVVCNLSFSPSSIYVDSNGQASTVNVTTNAPTCSWTSSAGGFITITSGGTGLGNGTVAFNISANATGADRTATLTIGGQVVGVTQRANAQIFADVPPPAYYFDFTNIMSIRGITAGCSTNPPEFCPNNNVTRGEMAVFIVTAVVGPTFTYTTTPYFTDVPPTDPFFKFIQKLRDLGITAGCSATQFCPDDDVTRAQMAAFIIRARYEATPYTYPSTPYFTDVPPTDIFFPSIQKMAQDGITSGCAPALYCPDATLPRGQMSVFIVTGLLNQLLPAGTAIISTAVPNTAAAGATLTVTLTGFNTHFAQNTTQIVLPPGITASGVTVASPTSLTVQLAIGASFVPGPVSIMAITGTEEAVLPNGFTVQ